MRRHALPFALAAWLLACAPAWSQPDAAGTGPAFSLWSSQVYRTTDQAAFSLTHRGLDHLDFRVYRVADPFAFFAGLKDPHALGSEKPVVPEERSWIERIAAWKSGRRAALRAFARRQVSVEYRQQRRAAGERRQIARRQTLRYNSFAQVPLLNPERLVASWREVLPNVREPETRRIPIERAVPGVYVVEAVSAPLRAYTIVVVSDIGIVTKTAPGQMLVFVADRTSGAPQRECEIRPLVDGRPLAPAATGADGTVMLTIDTPKPESVISVARCGTQVTVSDPGSWALQAPARDLVGYVYTDKPVYRPGHTVHVKGVLRWRTRGRLEMFDAGEAEVSIADSNDKVLAREKRPVDAFGAVSTSFAVPASAALGDYVVTVASGDDTASGTFQVQEYRKPEFEVTVAAPDRFALQGGRVQATLTARYYFGQPVAGATVKYVVHQQPYYSPLRWSGDADDPEGGWWGGGRQATEATARLDETGSATVVIPLGLDEDRRDYTARIEARVTDASNREVTGAALVHATYGRYLVTTQVDRYVQAPGATAQVTIRAIDYLGAPQAGATLDAVLERLTYPEGRWSDPTVTVIASGKVTTDPDGRASWSAALPAQPGSYRFRVTGQSEGRQVDDSSGVWVTGNAAEFAEGDAYLELIADRGTYQPGDTARLVIRGAAVTAPVLVTKEGRQISFYRVASADEGNGIEVPVEADDIGDTYVGVVYLKDDRLYRAEKRLKVPAAARQLRVTVEADRAVAKPRQPGVFSLTVTDADGRPVQAQLSVGVVDEAVYGVTPDATPDPLRFFYRLDYSAVSTDYSRDYPFVGYAGSQQILLTQRRRPFTLADFKREGQSRPQVRKDFPDAIYWAADVTSDARGRATVQVPYPDALTTWRLTARAVTADTRVGTALARTTTTKDLVLRVVTPRFLTEGDTLELPVIVHNYLPTVEAIRVDGEVGGLEVVPGGTATGVVAPQTLTVPSGGEAALTWTLKAMSAGGAVVKGSAVAGEESDAVELPFPVLPFGLRRETGKAASFAAPGEQAIDIEIPATSNPQARTIRVQVAPSLAGPVIGALDYLTSYPYGCTEQTLSGFVPNLAARRTLTELGLPLTEGLKSLDRQVTEGLARLSDYQHGDGGWGWWKTDENHPFMTAYAVYGLLEARRAGYKVDEWRLSNGLRALRRLYREYPDAVAELKAYETYVIMRAVEAGITVGHEERGPFWTKEAALDQLWSARSRMSAYGQSLLLLSLDLARDPRGAELAGDLAAGAQRKGDLAWWLSDRDPLLFDAVDTSVEATALAVQALSARDANHPLLEPAARWLLLNRTFGAYWASTKQTAIVLMGLLDLMKARRESATGAAIEVLVNGAPAGTHRFTARSMTSPEPAEFEAPAQAGTNRVKIVATGGGPVYWAVHATYYDTQAAGRRTGSRALALQREYFSLSPVTMKNRIVYRAAAFDGRARPGDVLLVRLTAAGAADWRYLLIEDPIAAGTEPIQNDDLYELEQGRRHWWGSRREFRDSRVVFFQERFDAGRYEFSYLLKVIAPGTFRASPARISAMYVPEGAASSAASSFVVGPPPAPGPAQPKGGQR